MKLYIKYMVSSRCQGMVKNELERIGIHNAVVELGEVEIKESISPSQKEEFSIALRRIDLQLIEDKKIILVERIKIVIIKLIHFTDKVLKVNFSEHLSKILKYNYTYLANLFSRTTGSTIEKLIIKHKIERVKELILHDELTITEIAHKLNYSSVSHLSNQFKRITGLTPTSFKRLRHKRLRGLENV